MRKIKNNQESAEVNVTIGKNDYFGDQLSVEELLNPFMGLCYAFTFDGKLDSAANEILFFKAMFENGREIPTVEVSYISTETRYKFLYYGADLTSFKFSLEVGNIVLATTKKTAWRYSSSCMEYTNESYLQCIMRKQVECFKARLRDGEVCKCLPKKAFSIQFENYPVKEWNECNTTSEYYKSMIEMDTCGKQKTVHNECPTPCAQEAYKGQSQLVTGYFEDHSRQIIIMISVSMEKDHYEEVLIQDGWNFIGTVGGSLSLFIGVTYTGLVFQLLDYLLKD